MKAEVSSVEKFMDKYNYAILKSAATEKMNGAPVVNERGQIIGIFNAGGTSQSATDANYAKDFVVKGLSQNDVALRQSNIRGWIAKLFGGKCCCFNALFGEACGYA